MARDGSGNYNRPAGQPVVSGTVIDSAVFNTLTADLAAALTQSISKDGQTTPTANIPLGTFRITGLGAGTGRTDAAQVAQIQDLTCIQVGTIGGTGDVITGSLTPAITTYTTNMVVIYKPTAANTGATTIALNGLAAKAINKGDGTVALIAGDLAIGKSVFLIYNGTAFVLQNPAHGTGADIAGPILIASGSLANCAYSFTGDPDTGVFRNGVNDMQLVANGAMQMRVTANGISVPDGTFTNPAIFFDADADNGFYRVGTNSIGVSTGGALSLTISQTIFRPTGVIQGADGTSSNPAFSFLSDTNSGMLSIGADDFGFYAGASLVAEVTNSTLGGFKIVDAAGGTMFDAGFRHLPQQSKSVNYTLVLADSGKHIYHPVADVTGRTWTIPANASVAFPIGTAVTFVTDAGAGNITIAITTDTLVMAGTGSTGSRTLASPGIATALKVTATRWMISGTGLS